MNTSIYQTNRSCKLDSLEIARDIVNAVEDKKAENIVLLDLRPDAIIADFFVICSAGSDRQIRAITDSVREAVKERYKKLPVSVEGQAQSGWVLMDYGDVIVHIFGTKEREYYNLDAEHPVIAQPSAVIKGAQQPDHAPLFPVSYS
jgi:ribosome-associated protein